MLATSFRLLLHRSLTRRMVLVQVIACALMLATLFCVLWQMTARSAKADTERNVMQMTHVLLNLQDPARTAPKLLAALLAVNGVPAGPSLNADDQIRFELRDIQGKLLAGSTASPRSVSSGWRTGSLRDPETGRTLIVSVSESAVARMWYQGAVQLMSQVAFLTLVVVVPVQLLVTVLVTQVGLAPLREFGHDISKRSPDNLAPINTVRRYLELTPLLGALNRLLATLQDKQTVEQRFFADAAHELLTPIAALHAQTHLLATAADEPAKAAARCAVESGLQRVASMIRQLLTMTRVSSTEWRLDLKRGDLAALVQERLGVAASRALDKGIQIELQAPHRCPCVFDSGAIASALDNVIDNAVRYMPPQGRIQVRLRRYAAAIWIAVADNGPGIDTKYRAKVFERFFRVPGNIETGSGLGLAIVAKIIALHQGTVMLLDGMGSRGLMVCIRLPAPQRP